VNDASLKKLVEEELDWEPSVDAVGIGVGVKDGVVTLMGHVNSYAQKLAAEHAVQRVKGVRAIAEDLEVRFAGSATSADDEIARRAANVIDWDSSIPKGKVKAKVENGYVTLSGEVEWRYQADRARNHVADLFGVKGVTSLIAVKPKVSASDVKDRIEKALMRSAEIEAKGIRVAVVDSSVTLEGQVDAWHDREVALQAAWAAPGIKNVTNNIRIG
jgi:osmotically-inducible protein OsmY